MPKTDDKGKDWYSIQMIFDKNDPFVKELVRTVKQVRDQHWGADYKGILDLGLRDGNEKYNADPEKNHMMKDKITLSAKCANKPVVVGRRREALISSVEFYGGCYAIAWLKAYTYEDKKSGVAFGLEGLQKVEDGDPFGAGSSIDPMKAFDNLEDGEDSPVDTSDPLGDLMS